MNAFEPDFSRIIDQHNDTLGERRNLKGILNDIFPKEDERSFVNALLIAYDLNIHQDIVKSPGKPDHFFVNRYAKRIVSEYGISESLAEVAVQTWVNCLYGKKLPSPPPLPPKDDPSDGRESEGSRPDQGKKPVSYRIPCGVGNQDGGFTISGIGEADRCIHPLRSVFAVVFSYFQKSTNAKQGKYIEQYEIKLGRKIEYGVVYRLQMILLLLIKNNYFDNHSLHLSFDDSQDYLKCALDNINFYAGKICELADIDYPELRMFITDDPTSPCHISLKNDSAPISVTHHISPEEKGERTSARVPWQESSVLYRVSDQNRPVLDFFLKEAFGFDEFRDGQYEAIKQMLNNVDRHSICIMPTGAGKSLVFYFLALLRSCPTFVICPTDVLIIDQMRVLERFNFDDVIHIKPDDDYRSSVPYSTLIYLTPLTFINHQLILRLIVINYHERIGYIILDEVHCISNWSHDFRPEYLMLSCNLGKFVDKTGYRCFTATANYTVILDIQKQLGIETDDILLPIPLEKDNVHFQFSECSTAGKLWSDAAARITGYIHSSHTHQKKALVFTKNKEASEMVKQALPKDISHEVEVYRTDNPESYDYFVQDKYKVLIADSDLGIGVDLPGVTDTVHAGIPISKSQYVQEFGRAGRQGEKACSTVMFLSRGAFPDQDKLLHRNTPIETIIDLCKNSREPNDTIDVYQRIFGGIEAQEQFFQGIMTLYDKLKSLRTNAAEDHCYLVLDIPAGEDRDGYREKQMRYMYVLFIVGFIKGWYLSDQNQAKQKLTFFVEFPAHQEHTGIPWEIINPTVQYLHNMGDYKKAVADINHSRTVEEVIQRFVDWHYHQFLYHHREQFLEMQNFLEVYQDKPAAMVREALRNYFSLSLIQSRADTDRVRSMTIGDITQLVNSGDIGSMIDDLRKSNENEYSPRIDYALFGYNLGALNNLDLTRLDRILSNLSEVDKIELRENIGLLYQSASDHNKLLILNALCKQDKFSEVIDTIYGRAERDAVFGWILASCANNRMGA